MNEVTSATISEPVEANVQTGTDDEALATDAFELRDELAAQRAKWQRFIDERLIEWGKSPHFESDDMVPPSAKAIEAAWKLAGKLRDSGMPAPLRVVPDGEGGIAFEFRAVPEFHIIEIAANGIAELTTYRDYRLCSRQELSVY